MNNNKKINKINKNRSSSKSGNNLGAARSRTGKTKKRKEKKRKQKSARWRIARDRGHCTIMQRTTIAPQKQITRLSFWDSQLSKGERWKNYRCGQSATLLATRSASSDLLSSRAVSFRPPLVLLVGAVKFSVLLLGSLSRLIHSPLPASLFFVLVQGGHKPLAPCSTPACHGIPPFTFAASVQTSFVTPKAHGLSAVEPCVVRNALKSSTRHAC